MQHYFTLSSQNLLFLGLTFEPGLNYDKINKPAFMKKLVSFLLSLFFLLITTSSVFAVGYVNPKQTKDGFLNEGNGKVTNNSTSVSLMFEGTIADGRDDKEVVPGYCYILGKAYIGTTEPINDGSKTETFYVQEKDNVDYLVEKHNLEWGEAMLLVKNEDEWNKFLTEIRKGTTLKSIELIAAVQSKIKEKVEQGFMEAAQKGGILLAILQDKTFGVPSNQTGPMFNVAGKQIIINTPWFKPYKKK